MGTWLDTTYRKLHLDYHQPPWMEGVAGSFTIEEARKQALLFKEAGVEAVEFFAYDHYGQAFYPSKIGVVHPNLQADYTGLMSAALKEQGIKTIIYFNALTSVHLHKLKPEWMRQNEDGTMPPGCWLQHDASHICITSNYLTEYFIPLMVEALHRFEPDAVWIDAGSWIVEEPCYCPNCREAYRAATGYELPSGNLPEPIEELNRPEWISWRMWKRGQIAPYVKQLVSAVKAVNPAILVAENNIGKSFLGIPLMEKGQFVRWLTPKEIGIDWLSCDPVHFGANHEIIISREGRYQTTTDLPFDYMNERFHGWGEWQMRPATDWKLEFATMMSIGARCFFADQPYPDGTIEPAVYQDLQPAYEFVKQREIHTVHASAVPDIAVLCSLPSQLFGPTAGAEWGRHSWGALPLSRRNRVDGASLLLAEAGIQYLIYDEATLRSKLHDQQLVIVPDQCLIEQETIQALEQYVAAGGRLIVTGRSGLWNEKGERRDHDPFAKLLGLERQGELPAPLHYWKADKGLAVNEAYHDVKLQAWGTAMQVVATRAVSIASLIEPLDCVWRNGVKSRENWQHYTTVGATPPGMSEAGPAILEHQYGEGHTMYMSSDLFSLYYLEGHRLTREWLCSCLNRIYPVMERKLHVDKPLHVEVSLMEEKQDDLHVVYVHAINYFAQKRPGYLIHNEEVPPVRDIVITLRSLESPTRVTLEPEGRALSYAWDGHTVTTSIPQLELHAIVRLEFARKKHLIK